VLRAVVPTRAAPGAPVRDPGRLEDEPDVDVTVPAIDPPDVVAPAATGEPGIASAQDDAGVPIHRGWAPIGSHHRWMEPFVLMLLANGAAHGYAVVAELAQLGITNGSVDVGQVYRTLRDLERTGQVRSLWMTGSGPARRDYELTEAGARALDEWAAVMKERKRLIGEFDAGYLAWAAAQLGLGTRP
jgi:PadR family transcriptional regulator, regulatory protein PadR